MSWPRLAARTARPSGDAGSGRGGATSWKLRESRGALVAVGAARRTAGGRRRRPLPALPARERESGGDGLRRRGARRWTTRGRRNETRDPAKWYRIAKSATDCGSWSRSPASHNANDSARRSASNLGADQPRASLFGACSIGARRYTWRPSPGIGTASLCAGLKACGSRSSTRGCPLRPDTVTPCPRHVARTISGGMDRSGAARLSRVPRTGGRTALSALGEFRGRRPAKPVVSLRQDGGVDVSRYHGTMRHGERRIGQG